MGLALLGAVACARRSEPIGRLGDGSISTVPPRADAGASPDTPGPAAAAGCPATTPPQVVPAPAWTCGNRDRCLSVAPAEPALFEGATVDPDPLRRPAIVYPPADSVHPRNLSHITLQWRRGSPGQGTFRIEIAPVDPGEVPIELYVPYAEPAGATMAQELDASFAVPAPVWRYVAQRNAGKEVRLRVAAHDPAAGVATSDPISIRFSPAAIEGGLYYLGTEPISAGIHRHVFGAARAEAMVAPATARNTSGCGGCHSVSRDGTTLAFAATYAGNLTVSRTGDLDHPTVNPPPPPSPDRADAVAPAVSPDGTRILARDGVRGDLALYDAAGTRLWEAGIDETQGRIDFPQWSPGGAEIVATRARGGIQPAKQYSAFDGHLVVMPYAQGRFGAPEVVVDEPLQVHAHPSWSPDGRWIVFVSSPVGGESYRNRNTRLRLVRREGGAILDLGRASPVGAGTNFPRFAPTGQQDCQLLFVTFHSLMDYGLLRRNAGAAEGGFQQLWMTAIDLSRLPVNPDPSTPPIWLPFQDIRQKNLLATWSALVPCSSQSCGPGATCQSGRCLATPD